MIKLICNVLVWLLVFYINCNSLYAQCTANVDEYFQVCAGFPVQLNASASTGSGNLTFSWSPAINLSCSDCPNPIATPNVSTLYTVTITDENLCTANASVMVDVLMLPNSDFSFVQSNACANIPVHFSPTMLNGNSTYQWNFGNPSSGASNTVNAPNVIREFVLYGNVSEMFNVQLVVIDQNGCQSSTNQMVHINGTPQAVLSDPLSSFRNCDGTDFNVTLYDGSPHSGNLHTISWGDGSPNFVSTTPPVGGVSHLYNTADIFDVYYMIQGENGCIDTAHYLISNITNPAIGAANPGATTGCGPITLCFPLSNYTNNHPSTYYIVDYGDGSPVDTIQHVNLPPTICHVYNTSSCGRPGNAFTFVIQAENPCDISVATVNPIRVYTAPQPNFNAPQRACLNSAVSFSSTTVTGFNSSCQSTTIYQWNFGDGTVTAASPALANTTHAYTQPGVYTVTLTTQNNCGSFTFTREICIEARPTPQAIFTPNPGCIPFVAQVENNSDTTNMCQLSRSWSLQNFSNSCTSTSGSNYSFINGTNAQSWEPTIQINNAGVYTFRLRLQNSCGTYDQNISITAQDKPIVTLTAPTSVCKDQTLNPSVSVNNCYATVTDYEWDLQGATPSTATTQNPGTISYAASGTYPIAVDVTNVCGTTTQTRNIVVTEPPLANAGPDVAYCTGQTATIGTTGVSGVTYQWSPTTNLTNSSQAVTTVNLTNATQTPIVRDYVLTASTSNVCLSRDTVRVTVNPRPIFTVPNASLCLGNSVPLQASSANENMTYTWSNGATLSCNDCPNPTANPTVTSTYSVIGTNEFGCTNNVNTTVTVNPLPVVNAGSDRVLCDQPIAVTLTGTPAGGTWSGSPNVTSTGVFTPNGEAVELLTYTYTHPTTGCSNSDEVQVTVSAPIVPQIRSLDSLCSNATSVNLSAFLTPNPTGGTFTVNGVTATTFNPATLGVGNHQVIYTFGSATCASKDTAVIKVNPLPTLNVQGSTICSGEEGTLVVSSSIPNTNFQWNTNPLLSCDDCTDPTASPTTTTTFTVVGTTLSGCSRTGSALITVNPLPIVNAGADQILCNQPVLAQLTGTPAGGTWSGSPDLTASGGFTPNGVGVFPLTYSYTQPATGCHASDEMIVTVQEATIPTFAVNPEVCVNNGLTNLSTLTNPQPIGGTWSGVGVVGTNFNPQIAGVGTITLNYTYGVGTCQTVTPITIIVRPQPQLTSENHTICFGETANLIVSSDLPDVTYSWNPTTNLSCTDCANPIANPGSTTTYSTVVTSVFGCQNSINSTVTVNPLPLVNAGADTTLCNQAIGVSFNGVSVGGTWSGPMITAGGIFTPQTNGTFTVTYSVVNTATGCTDSDEKVVTVVEPQIANAGQDLERCTNLSTETLSGLPSGGVWSGLGVDALGNYSLSVADTFHFVYAIGAGNCLNRDTMRLVVHPLPVVSANDDFDMCISASTPVLSSTPIGGVYTGNGIVDGVNGIFDASLAGEGVHTITYTFIQPATGCINSDDFVITVRPLPVVGFDVDPVVCLNAAVSFVNTSSLIDQVLWRFGEGSTSTSIDGLHTYTAIGNYTIDLIVTTVFGCQDSIQKTIAVYEPPVANFSVTPDSLCGPLVASFMNQSSGQAISYSWDFGNGTTSIVENPSPVTYPAGLLADTSYTISLAVSNLCGTVIHRDTIIVMPVPVAQFGTNFSTFCSPFTPQIANTSFGLPDNFLWDFGNGLTGTISDSIFQLPVYVADSDTVSYTITLTVENECGSNTAQQTITVVPNNVIPFFNTNVTEGCTPLTVQFTQYTLGGTNYSWDLGDGTQTSTYSPSHTYTQAGTYNVALMANNGCSFDTTIVQITVYEAPHLAFSYLPDSVCVWAPFQFVNESEPVFNYHWDFGDGNTSNVFSPSHAYASSGNFNVTLTGVSIEGFCTTSHTQQIFVNVPPVADFDANPVSGCVPVQVNFTNNSSGHAYSSWNFGDGNTSGLVNVQHNYTDAGVYIAQLIVRAVNGCTDTMTRYINVHEYPVAQFEFQPDIICGPDAAVQFVNTTTGAVTFQWDFGDGSTSALNNPNHIYLTPGNYTVQLQASNEFGCTDTYTQIMNVHQRPLPSFNVSTLVGCQNAVLDFTSNSQFTDSIAWNFGDGNIANGFSVEHIYTQPGAYSTSITAYNQFGCSANFVLGDVINIAPAPVANFSAEQNLEVVNLATVEFTNLSTGHTSSYWDLGNGEFTTEEHPTYNYMVHGQYYVTLIVFNQNGCADTIRKFVNNPIKEHLYVPNAISPGHSSYEVSHFLPKGIGLKDYHLEIYDDWGNLIWESTALDSYGRPLEGWDGTYKGVPVQQDAYVWQIKAVFVTDEVWEGKEYPKGKVKKSGTVTVIR